MKRLIIGLFAILALSAMTATAFAGNTVFLCNGAFVTQAKTCLVVSENLEVQVLYDLGASSGVECKAASVLDEGWAGPGSEDEVTSVEFMSASTECKPTAKGLNTKEEEVTNACKKVAAVEAIHLPWATLLVLEGSLTYDLLLPGSSGEQPGYLILCEIVGGTKQNDECTVNASHSPYVEVQQLDESGEVLLSAYFPKVLKETAERANCTVGGNETGLVLGEDLQAVPGGSLEISEE